jgi:DNA (cytosine-5)-methyltransferase 1
MLQGFPREYRFVPKGERPSRQAVGRLIGNAVPPQFGMAVGRQFVNVLSETTFGPVVAQPS